MNGINILQPYITVDLRLGRDKHTSLISSHVGNEKVDFSEYGSWFVSYVSLAKDKHSSLFGPFVNYEKMNNC